MSELAPQVFRITRADLVRYAGASGDFNPIHWSDRVATGVGLPGVIAHGMLTMALVGRAVTAWVGGDPGAIIDYQVRFTRPVVVPDDDDGAELTVSGVVKKRRRRRHRPARAHRDLRRREGARAGTGDGDGGGAGRLGDRGGCRVGKPPGYPYTGRSWVNRNPLVWRAHRNSR